MVQVYLNEKWDWGIIGKIEIPQSLVSTCVHLYVQRREDTFTCTQFCHTWIYVATPQSSARIIPSTQGFIMLPFLPSPYPQPPVVISLPSIHVILLFEEHCIKGIIQYITFWDIFFLLGTLLLGSIPDAVCIIFLPNEINRFILATE